jgi:hypothetical protein
MRAFFVTLIAVCTVTTLAAQEARPAQTDPEKPVHGIIRKPSPKPAGSATRAPVASKEAAAAAIAAAVRSVDDTKGTAAPVRPATRPTEPRAPLRRYEVRWPSQRVDVAWDTPDERVTLSWQAPDAEQEQDRGSRGPQP